MSKSTYDDEKRTRHSIAEIEDATKYGEFISSYFAWLTLDRQKKKAKEMDQMTKRKEP